MADVRGSTPLGSTLDDPSDLRKRGWRGLFLPVGKDAPGPRHRRGVEPLRTRSDRERTARFTALYVRDHPRVCAYVHRRSGDRGAAEELTAEVFRTAWERMTAGHEVGTGWLFVTTRNLLSNHHRSMTRLTELHRTIADGGVTFFSLHGDPAGPGSHQAAPAGRHAGPGRGPGGDAMVDEPYYGSTAKLEGAAKVMVRARLGAGHEEDVDGVSTTVASAKVVATAKGETSGDSIQVAYTTPGSGPGTVGFIAGQEYVLLLDRGAGGRYVLVNTTQGWYEVEGGAAVAGKDNHVALSPGVRKALRLDAQGR
ncbi:RNA polymerase sigma factor [Streptomyces sp. NPDC020192]|uniref:RNA polymerase sigma factor n=1 Tax=Streptomyces sp. NPDC020192 TaxID=3365066 RepID=UPI0037A6B122